MSIKISNDKDWKFIAGRIGPRLTLILGIFYFIDGIVGIFIFFLTSMIMLYPDTPFTLSCGILALLGVLLGIKGYKNARFLCLIAGILGVTSLLVFNVILRFFLTLFQFILPLGPLLFFVNLIVPFILLIGGILSVISGEDFLRYYRDRRDPNPIQGSKMASFFCPYCGIKALPADNFCRNCGKKV